METDDHTDASTTFTCNTPTSSVMNDTQSVRSLLLRPPSIPRPGATFILRSNFYEKVLALLGGQVVLTNPTTRGSVYWECFETKGWLGFRNIVSGKLLGYDNKSALRCTQDRHQDWEWFCLRPHVDGGYILYMLHAKDQLQPVNYKEIDGKQRLARIEKGTKGIAWDFLEVDDIEETV